VKPYADRREAGRQLAAHVVSDIGYELRRPIVLALPRGGVPVGAEVAKVLDAPLDVIVVRKVGVVGQREVAMGAVATVAGVVETVTNMRVLSELEHLGRPRDEFAEVARRERLELARRDDLYRGGRPPLDVAGRAAVVVDDGVATGASMRAAVTALRQSGPDRVVVAVPVCLPGAMTVLEEIADDVVCPWRPRHFMAVGQAYQRFDQTDDDEVRAILATGSRGLG
jgi:putative phosphoribosyl transferase